MKILQFPAKVRPLRNSSLHLLPRPIVRIVEMTEPSQHLFEKTPREELSLHTQSKTLPVHVTCQQVGYSITLEIPRNITPPLQECCWSHLEDFHNLPTSPINGGRWPGYPFPIWVERRPIRNRQLIWFHGDRAVVLTRNIKQWEMIVDRMGGGFSGSVPNSVVLEVAFVRRKTKPCLSVMASDIALLNGQRLHGHVLERRRRLENLLYGFKSNAMMLVPGCVVWSQEELEAFAESYSCILKPILGEYTMGSVWYHYQKVH